MRCVLTFALAFMAACYSPNPKDGQLACSDDDKCPNGYTCSAVDKHCYRPGHEPEADMGMTPDDLGDVDGGAVDMMEVVDLTVVKHQGEACGAGDTCDTGHCVDGYCCENACNNTCQACNVPGSLGL